MMSFKKTYLQQVSHSVIMYLKRNFSAPPHQKPLLPLWNDREKNLDFDPKVTIYFKNKPEPEIALKTGSRSNFEKMSRYA